MKSALGGFLDVIGAHKRMAAEVHKTNRYALMCHVCPHTIPITQQQFAQYLAGGWPKHCGRQMELLSEPKP